MAATRAKRRAISRKTFYFFILPVLVMVLVAITILGGPEALAALWLLMGLMAAYVFYFEEGREPHSPILEISLVVASGLFAVGLIFPETRFVKHPRDGDPTFAGTINRRDYERHARSPEVQSRINEARRSWERRYGYDPAAKRLKGSRKRP